MEPVEHRTIPRKRDPECSLYIYTYVTSSVPWVPGLPNQGIPKGTLGVPLESNKGS